MSMIKSQKPDYEKDKFTEFKKFINDLIRKRSENKQEYEDNRSKYQSLISSLGNKLYGKIFYIVLKDLEQDIDKACDTLFIDYKWNKIEGESEGTKLAQLISSFARSEAQIASAAGIKKARFNRVKNDSDEDLYASEVYGVAKVLDIRPKLLFEYFYGEGNKPIIGSKTE